MNATMFYDTYYNTDLMRVDKKEARRCYERGLPVVFCPCKLRPVSIWYTAAYIYGEGDTCFDTVVNSFEYYNCDHERGYYTAFYIPVVKYEQGENEPFIPGGAPDYIYNFELAKQIKEGGY